MSRVNYIVSGSQLDSAINEQFSVILYMIPHCPHCMKFLPGFSSLSVDRHFASVSFYQVNIAVGEGLVLARRNSVGGVPHATFYSRGRRLGDMRGDNVDEFKKILSKHQSERTWSGAGYTLGARAGGGVEPVRAMGESRGANADALEQLAPPSDKVRALSPPLSPSPNPQSTPPTAPSRL
jgi:hypothetical protein